MAELTDEVCGNCDGTGCVLFCANEFTDFLCKKCGAKNLHVTLPKVETTIPCISADQRHDVRIARKGLFCVKCMKYLIDEIDDPLLPFYTGDGFTSWFWDKENKISRSPMKNSV